MYTDTITLFNRMAGDNGDIWFPTVLHNVQLTVDRAAILAKYGADAADSAILHIRFQKEDGKIMICGKQWLPPKEWAKQEDHTELMTFATGTKFDFFVLGDVGYDASVSDSDFAEHIDFYTYMNKTHDNVFAISSVGGPYDLIPHFEIMGK